MKIAQIFQIVLLLILLPGCSRIKIAYNQLDWLLPYYLESQMDLSSDQRSYLKNEVQEMLAWHCAMHLANYAKLFRQANADFQRGKMSHERLEYFSAQIEQFWLELMHQVYPVVTQLLLTAKDDQLAELFYDLEQKNREWLAEYKQQSNAELDAEYLQHMTEVLERWFGPLQEVQQQAIRVWVKQFIPLGMEGFEMRRNWQSKLRGLTVQRNNVIVFKVGIETLLLNPELLHSAAYQKRLDDNRKVTKELLYIIGKQLNDTQRRHLAEETYAIARDFDDLACNNVSDVNADNGIMQD